jgi:hypothetical protein
MKTTGAITEQTDLLFWKAEARIIYRTVPKISNEEKETVEAGMQHIIGP